MDIDIKKIRELARVVRDMDLSAVKVAAGDWEVTLERHHAPAAGHPPQHAVAVHHAAPAPVAPAPPVAAPVEAPSEPGTDVITSPMVGTFYTSSTPGATAFTNPGDKVEEDTVVCIVEAMKVMNEIRAGKKGIVTEVLVTNAQPVEYGQPLFKLKQA